MHYKIIWTSGSDNELSCWIGLDWIEFQRCLIPVKNSGNSQKMNFKNLKRFEWDEDFYFFWMRRRLLHIIQAGEQPTQIKKKALLLIPNTIRRNLTQSSVLMQNKKKYFNYKFIKITSWKDGCFNWLTKADLICDG